MIDFYHTESFEHRAYETQAGADKFLPAGFIPYTVGQEPQELLNHLAYRSPEQIIQEGEAIVHHLVQRVVDQYNADHKLKYTNVDSCFKYTTSSTYTHQQFCKDIVQYNAELVDTARQVQQDIEDGVVEQPTTATAFIAMLPVYSGVV